MNSAVRLFLCILERVEDDIGLMERPLLDRLVDPNDVLPNYSACPDVKMSVGKANISANLVCADYFY